MSNEQNIPSDKSDITNSESENVNENISRERAIEQPGTSGIENQTSQVQNMDIHSLPHHRRKKFREYFLEFLMVFLGVTMGFFAENYREYLVERSKEKEYMESMITDLQKDTMKTNVCIRGNRYLINGHDSLENMLEKTVDNPEFLRKLYYINTAFTWADIGVKFTEGTFSALKSSGNLRLIQNKELTDAILKYESTKGDCDLQHAYAKESISKTYFFANDIFDISYYRKYNDFLNADYQNRLFLPYEKVKQYISEKPQLLTNDKIFLKKYSRLVNNEKDQIALYLFFVEVCRETASRLMQEIKKQYNFK